MLNTAILEILGVKIFSSVHPTTKFKARNVFLQRKIIRMCTGMMKISASKI